MSLWSFVGASDDVSDDSFPRGCRGPRREFGCDELGDPIFRDEVRRNSEFRKESHDVCRDYASYRRHMARLRDATFHQREASCFLAFSIRIHSSSCPDGLFDGEGKDVGALEYVSPDRLDELPHAPV